MTIKPTTTFFSEVSIDDSLLIEDFTANFIIDRTISKSFLNSNLSHDLIVKEILFAILKELLTNEKTRELLYKFETNELKGSIVCTTESHEVFLISIPAFLFNSYKLITASGENLTRTNFETKIWEKGISSVTDDDFYLILLDKVGYINTTLAEGVKYYTDSLKYKRLYFRTAWISSEAIFED